LRVEGEKNGNNYSDNPITIQDVFFRTAAESPSAKMLSTVTSFMTINANDVILENLWLWRQDHWLTPVSQNPKENMTGWTDSKVQYGLIINGNRVHANALFIEHTRDIQLVWNGNDGTLHFYQSELPYNVTKLADWICSLPDGTQLKKKGCPSIYIGKNVTKFDGQGISIYSYLLQDQAKIDKPPILVPSVIMIPGLRRVGGENGINLKHVLVRFLGDTRPAKVKQYAPAANHITHIVYDYGNKVYYPAELPVPNTIEPVKDSTLGYSLENLAIAVTYHASAIQLSWNYFDGLPDKTVYAIVVKDDKNADVVCQPLKKNSCEISYPHYGINYTATLTATNKIDDTKKTRSVAFTSN